MSDVLAVLPRSMTPWQRAGWMVARNALLDGAAPLDRIAEDDARVVTAAAAAGGMPAGWELLRCGAGLARLSLGDLARRVPMRRDPFKGHRFFKSIILMAVRWYCRFPLSSRDVRDLLAERGVQVDATVYRWVQKFGPEIARRASRHRSWRGLNWHVDETYVRVNGRWCYLWRAVDQRGQFIDFRLTARRNLSAARAFFRRARDNARLYQPLSITTDKAWTYARIVAEMNRGRGADDMIEHITRRRHNNIIESDHAALKRLTTPMRGFRSLSSAKATLSGIEAIRTIKKHQYEAIDPGVAGGPDSWPASSLPPPEAAQ